MAGRRVSRAEIPSGIPALDDDPAARVQTISFGKEKPVVVGSNEQSWAQNRRGVLAID